MKFTLHSAESAPAGSQPLLNHSLKAFGMIPNLHAVMADSPPVLEAYQSLHQLFEKTSFEAGYENQQLLEIILGISQKKYQSSGTNAS